MQRTSSSSEATIVNTPALNASELCADATQPVGAGTYEQEQGESPTAWAGVDRRSAQRRHYSRVQRLAPRMSDDLPSFDTYIAVQCRDISTAGFSFCTTVPP